MNIPCPGKVTCSCTADPADPFANLSAELPDNRSWIGISDTFFGKCYCISYVSQQAADDCADLCSTSDGDPPFQNPNDPQPPTDPNDPNNPRPPNNPTWPRGPGITYGPPPGIGTGNFGDGGGGGGGGVGSWYCNSEQTCCVTISNVQYCYTVAAGTICSPYSQADADARAYSLACDNAIENGRIRTREILIAEEPADNGCPGDYYTFIIQCSSDTAPTDEEPWFFEIIDGALPPGIELEQYGYTSTYASLMGTATAPGTYTFTVQVSPVYGDGSQKEYTIKILEITTDSTLPYGVQTEAYSQSLSANVSGLIWSIAGGALPGGLTLNPSTGIISGTPTANGTFNFTVSIETDDEVPGICYKDFSLKIYSSVNTTVYSWHGTPNGASGVALGTYGAGLYRVIAYDGGNPYGVAWLGGGGTIAYGVATSGNKEGGGAGTSPWVSVDGDTQDLWGLTERRFIPYNVADLLQYVLDTTIAHGTLVEFEVSGTGVFTYGWPLRPTNFFEQNETYVIGGSGTYWHLVRVGT